MLNESNYPGLATIPTGRARSWIVPGCLALEGGAFRGVYTEGVLDALMEADINLQTTIGVSAGALNGINYVAGHIGRAARMNLLYRHDSRYVGLTAMRRNHGVIGFDFMFGDGLDGIEPLDAERLMRPERRFVAVATNLNTGKAEYFETGRCENIFLAAQASASMPYVSMPVMIDDQPYLDGGCAVKIPYQWALDRGYRKIVVVRTRPRDYRKPVTPRKDFAATKTFYRHYPEFSAALRRSSENYNRQCDELMELEAEGRIFVIAPSRPIEISRLEGDMEKLGALYDTGYLDARNNLDGLKEYLELT